MIELDQNTNREHPGDDIQICPVTQVKLWRIGVQGRGKGWGEAGWKLKMIDQTRCINWVGREGLTKFFSSITFD